MRLRTACFALVLCCFTALTCDGDNDEPVPAVTPPPSPTAAATTPPEAIVPLQATATRVPFVAPTPVPLTTPSPSLGGVAYPLPVLREEIAIIGVDGSNRRHVVASEDVIGDLVWLRDGRLAYSTYNPTLAQHSNDETRTYDSKVFVVDTSGSQEQVYEGRSAVSLSSSPSGEWLEIYETTGWIGLERQLTFLNLKNGSRHAYPIRIRSPGWHPHDDYFYYVQPASEPGATEMVRVRPGMAPETVLDRPFTETVRFQGGDADFTRFVFVSDGNDRLYVADLASGSLSLLVTSRFSSSGPWHGDDFLYTTDNYYGLPEPPRLWVYAADGRSRLLLEGVQLHALAWTAAGNVLYATNTELVEIDVVSGISRTVHTQSDIEYLFPFGDGNAVLLARDTCWIACHGGPIDVVLLSDKQAQTLPALGPPSRFVLTADGSTVFWGSSSVVEAGSNGTWRQLVQAPESTYRHVVLSPDESQLAHAQSFRGGQLTIEVDVTTGVYRHIDPTGLPNSSLSRDPLVQLPPDPRFPRPIYPATPPDCRPGTLPLISPDHKRAAWINPCLGGVILIDVSTGDWAVLLKPDWCRHMHNRNTALRWRDDTHLIVVARGDLC